MRAYSRTHVTDHDLLCNLKSPVAQDRATTAELVADIAEVDPRRLFAPGARHGSSPQSSPSSPTAGSI
jgi:hypothetical protein